MHGFAGNDDDILNTFVVMEYCNGGTLAQALQNRQFFTVGKKPNIPLVLMRAIDIAHALEHLHAHCVVHGDLKPANVLLHMTHKDSSGFVCKVGFALSVSRWTTVLFSVHVSHGDGTFFLYFCAVLQCEEVQCFCEAFLRQHVMLLLEFDWNSEF